jgi:molecular chaperone GrpE
MVRLDHALDFCPPSVDIRADLPMIVQGTGSMTDVTAANSNEVSPVGGDGTTVRADVETLSKELADHKDKLLRSLADMENLRRRTEREMTDTRTYAITSFARDVIGVADNIRRALQAAGEAGGLSEGPAKALLEGVELTEREMLKVLEKHGVKRLDPQGAKFDPNFHQAMFEVPDANVPSGCVVQVVQPGYVIADRVLRPALVGVSKGGPRTAPSQQAVGEQQLN